MFYMVFKLDNFFVVEKIVSVNFVLSCVKFMIYVLKFDIENNIELGYQCFKFYIYVLSQFICNVCLLKSLILIFFFKYIINKNYLKKFLNKIYFVFYQ